MPDKVGGLSGKTIGIIIAVVLLLVLLGIFAYVQLSGEDEAPKSGVSGGTTSSSPPSPPMSPPAQAPPSQSTAPPPSSPLAAAVFTAADEGAILHCPEDGGIYRVEGGKARHFTTWPVFAREVPSLQYVNDGRVCGTTFPRGSPYT